MHFGISLILDSAVVEDDVNAIVPVVPLFEDVYVSLKLEILIRETGLILYNGSSNLVRYNSI